jgi:hypothetical protein
MEVCLQLYINTLISIYNFIKINMSLVEYYNSGFDGEDTRAIPIDFLRYASTYFRNLPDDVLKYIYTVLLGYNQNNGYFINKLIIPNLVIPDIVNESVYLRIPMVYKKPKRFEPSIIKSIVIKHTNMYEILNDYFSLGYTDPSEENTHFILIEYICDGDYEYHHSFEVYNIRFTKKGTPRMIECKNFSSFADDISQEYYKHGCNEFVQITTENNSFKIVDRTDLSCKMKKNKTYSKYRKNSKYLKNHKNYKSYSNKK